MRASVAMFSLALLTAMAAISFETLTARAFVSPRYHPTARHVLLGSWAMRITEEGKPADELHFILTFTADTMVLTTTMNDTEKPIAYRIESDDGTATHIVFREEGESKSSQATFNWIDEDTAVLVITSEWPIPTLRLARIKS